MLAQAKLKEGHLLFLWVVVLTQLVVKEAAEKLDVALLRVDS